MECVCAQCFSVYLCRLLADRGPLVCAAWRKPRPSQSCYSVCSYVWLHGLSVAFQMLLVCCLNVVVMHAHFRYCPGRVGDCRSSAAATAAACSPQARWSTAGAAWSAFDCILHGMEVVTSIFPWPQAPQQQQQQQQQCWSWSMAVIVTVLHQQQHQQHDNAYIGTLTLCRPHSAVGRVLACPAVKHGWGLATPCVLLGPRVWVSWGYGAPFGALPSMGRCVFGSCGTALSCVARLF